jgi:chromosome segregation ATPase
MPEDNEKVEDFISLWKKKMDAENSNRPSVIGETLNKVDVLQQENQELRKKMAENVHLISRTEEIIRNATQEKEKIKIESEQALKAIETQLNQREKENTELSNKIKSTVQLIIEKDQEINELHATIDGFQQENQDQGNLAIIEELKSELTKYKKRITDLEKEILENKKQNEELRNQLVQKLKPLPANYVLPVETPKPDLPSNVPLEILCQDLQSDLNKYKKVIQKLKQENSELGSALKNKGINLNDGDIQKLQQENEVLKKDLESLQNQLDFEQKVTLPSPDSSNLEEKITELELKLQEKDNIITELKLNKIEPQSIPTGPMASLVDDLQKNINKLKLTIKEKDNEIEELRKLKEL